MGGRGVWLVFCFELCMLWRFVDSKHCVRMACVKLEGSREGMLAWLLVLVAWCL
jgi:hypothetical protein